MSTTKPKKVNVLIYAGPGSTLSSVKHATHSLRTLLGSHYAVLTITSDQLHHEPWTSSCALLVFPGGADLGYCRTLNGDGNRRIKQYVQLGGKYLGLCAGGYYGSARCEFEVGSAVKGMEVVGTRELGFFPGICRGLAFGGFVYHSEAGARAAELEVQRSNFGTAVLERFRAYYNGGGVFVDAEKYWDQGVEVLAGYADEIDVKSGESRAAVVYCKVGEGAAVLTGPHPEFSSTNLNPLEPSRHDDYAAVVTALRDDEGKRVDFMKACLSKLGLQISQGTDAVPTLSRLHISSSQPAQVTELLHVWHEQGILCKREDGRETIEGENDLFVLHQAGRWDMDGMNDALTNTSSAQAPTDRFPTDSLPDYNALPKTLVAHEDDLPDIKETPHFNHRAFFAHLAHYNKRHASPAYTFGHTLMYGETVTSTSTLLEKNHSWLAHLPDGFTATATTQVAGRGRGTNVWVSPPGSLMFSTVLRHSFALSATAPVVFVQYLIALAIVAAIKKYDSEEGSSGYARIPVRLKWPNDIYALDPGVPAPADGEPASPDRYVKIGGILVNSSYAGGDYTLICGIGLNVSNPSPTTSLNTLLAKQIPGLEPFRLEPLLAAILSEFENLYTRFRRTGWDSHFQQLYYSSWLHSGQTVTLEAEGGVKARIEGISTDLGLLVAREVGTGRRWELRSDCNSFDFFKGLVRTKV
ncbi:hypothetical protein LTR62_004112 [Meristemomyces frigidus]|uniref:BPL/LPL catalytic domain-containing protein n=1 Tax=Meristemomyces frigidus TaxID=1508187 RepID=A0AAN7TJE7_9PEZI|nr:hypothetical protein LTR62_004112 [Meristemomyces frigidus]